MAVRSGRLLKPDNQGQYARQLGWKQDARGRRVQHKFRLGPNKIEAKERDARLQKLWGQIETDHGAEAALWDELTLEIARQIAQGVDLLALAPLPGEASRAYAARLQQIQNRFPFLRFQAANQELYMQGLGDRAQDLRDIVCLDNPYEDYWKRTSPRHRYSAPALKPDSDDGIVLRGDPVTRMLANYRPITQTTDDGKTLHQALEAYQTWIKEEYRDEVSGNLSDYAHTKLGQVETLKARHADMQLSEVDFDHIEKMYRYWRQRPLKDSRGGRPVRISHQSIRHYLGELHRFFKWLHRSKLFAWRKPDDFEDLDRTICLDTATVKQRIRQVETFNLEELRLLNRYATPVERLYLLLGLNCGFGTKEIATLTIGEISLHQALPASEQEAIGFRSTSADSFVSLVRNKTTIAGNFSCFRRRFRCWNGLWLAGCPNRILPMISRQF